MPSFATGVGLVHAGALTCWGPHANEVPRVANAVAPVRLEGRGVVVENCKLRLAGLVTNALKHL